MPHASTGSPIPVRVLVVDDSEWLRQGIRGALERAGLVVVGEPADGGQALVQAAADTPMWW
jgi:DNA-binding NarL/FixJ family response regulator